MQNKIQISRKYALVNVKTNVTKFHDWDGEDINLWTTREADTRGDKNIILHLGAQSLVFSTEDLGDDYAYAARQAAEQLLAILDQEIKLPTQTGA